MTGLTGKLRSVSPPAAIVSLLAPVALAGFAVAQPLYSLLLSSPEFFSVRQLVKADLWALALVLSFALPLVPASLALPARNRWPFLSAAWTWLVTGIFASLFFAQLMRDLAGDMMVLHFLASLLPGFALAWSLLFTRWTLLGKALALVSLVFPAWFLAMASPTPDAAEFPAPVLERPVSTRPLPDIVFVLWDELPLATLLDNDLQVDARLFPGFARLQHMSDWYFDTLTASPGTVTAVPAILTGRFPEEGSLSITAAEQPVSLFTLLAPHYQLNVLESSTRLCPEVLCPQPPRSFLSRFRDLLLDLSAVFLHRVSPDRLQEQLPDVSNNWSGFFAPQRVFFEGGWQSAAGRLTEMDRPAAFRAFADGVAPRTSPSLHFVHLLFPHGPYAYLPDGRNYGHEWLRGRDKAIWEEHEWGPTNSMQRHYFQAQLADRMMGELLDRLQDQGMLDDSLLVVVSDHGLSFAPGDWMRSTTGEKMAATLRVPWFIKRPGQLAGSKIDARAMTTDVLPTLLGLLGFDPRPLALDGLDLAENGHADRTRIAMSVDAKISQVDESHVAVSALVAGNRSRLNLDSGGGPWAIGPFAAQRGQPLESVCLSVGDTARIRINPFRPLPNTRPEDSIASFVSGRFVGEEIPVDPTPFVISNNGRIVASGETWWFNDQTRFFAMVEPDQVGDPAWAPQAFLVENGHCRGGSPP